MRTLEQKISDAGPNDQRIDPHILTEVRNDLLVRGGSLNSSAAGTAGTISLKLMLKR